MCIFRPHNSLTLSPIHRLHIAYRWFENSRRDRKYFNLPLGKTRRDRRRRDELALNAVTSSISESKPKLSVYPQYGFSPTLNTRDLTESGIAVKFLKTGGKSSRTTRCDGDVNVKLDSEMHRSKQFGKSFSTDDGITSDLRDEHPANARKPIDVSFESVGKLIIVSPTQQPKLEPHKCATDAGTQIDSSRQQPANA
jgi:hypothetical protein